MMLMENTLKTDGSRLTVGGAIIRVLVAIAITAGIVWVAKLVGTQRRSTFEATCKAHGLKPSRFTYEGRFQCEDNDGRPVPVPLPGQ
jgi:hypothetical protein